MPAQPAPADAATTRKATTRDASEFGIHIKQGGWRLGLLVARNVVKAPGRVSADTLYPKTNATAFAKVAHTSPNRVLHYLEAWQRAAAAGHVPNADTLSPGQEIDLDAERLPDWREFYRSMSDAEVERRRVAAQEMVAQQERARLARQSADEAAAAQRRADNIRRLEAAATGEDRQVEQAGIAFRENGDRLLAQADLHLPDGRAVDVETPPAERINADRKKEVREILGAIRSYSRRMFDVARDEEWTDDGREAASVDLRNLAQQLLLVADVAADPTSATVTDEALATLLKR